MKLVIDSNRFMAGLLKDSTSRRIIYDRHLEFCSPDYLITEIRKHRNYLAKKTKQTDEEIDVALFTLLDKISLIPYEEFKDEMVTAMKIMEDIDIKDAPFLAVGLALNADGIWTEDEHFHEQKLLKVYSTKELTALIQGKEAR